MIRGPWKSRDQADDGDGDDDGDGYGDDDDNGDSDWARVFKGTGTGVLGSRVRCSGFEGAVNQLLDHTRKLVE